MFKRVRWAALGAVAGVGGSMWARRSVRRGIKRYQPEQLGAAARARLARATDEVRAAIGEGREAMVEREAELRARLPYSPLSGQGEVIEARALDPAPSDRQVRGGRRRDRRPPDGRADGWRPSG
jgi:hypothetical protein